MAEYNVHCKFCGMTVSNKATVCFHCGRRLKMALWLKIVIVVFAIMIITGVNERVSSVSRSSGVSPTVTARTNDTPIQTVVDIRPDDQKKFEEICSQYRAEYDRAGNEIQQSAARNGRKNALQQFGIKSAQDWIGTIDNLSTNNDGKGVITIKLQSGLKISTWNNAISDIRDGTLISPESTVFNSLMNLKKGENVQFSGDFITGSDTDYLRMTGMNTRDAMEMRNDGFLMIFADITSLK